MQVTSIPLKFICPLCEHYQLYSTSFLKRMPKDRLSMCAHTGLYTILNLGFYAWRSKCKGMRINPLVRVTIRRSRVDSFFLTNSVSPCAMTALSATHIRRLDGTKSLVICESLTSSAILLHGPRSMTEKA